MWTGAMPAGRWSSSVTQSPRDMSPPLIDRSGYPTLRECVYLNQASLGLIADPAVDAMHDLLDRVVRHGNLHMTDDDEAGFLDGLRGRAAGLLSVDETRIALVSGASELLGQAPFLLSPRPGSKVIAVATDFPAITRPWLRLAERGECIVEFVEDRPGSDLTADLVARIDARTSVLAVGWVQYATGTVIDVPRIRAATDEAGVRLVLDATQGAGAMRCDGDDWRADLMVSSGYKWLGGPGGVAIGALAPDVIDQVPPLPGWMGAPSPFAFDATRIALAEGARRFTQSTMSYLSVAGLTTAMDQLLGVGLDRVEQHAMGLRDLLLRAVEDRGWLPFRHRADPAAAPHIVSLRRPGMGSADALQRLGSEGIVCSLRGDRLRVSLSPYNDEDDIAALATALA
jgi:cysteine desulfurase/selenocysteine lyase